MSRASGRRSLWGRAEEREPEDVLEATVQHLHEVRTTSSETAEAEPAPDHEAEADVAPAVVDEPVPVPSVEAAENAYWAVWREPISHAVREILHGLHTSLPGGSTTSMVLTPSGLDICSVQLSAEDAPLVAAAAARMCALAATATARAAGRDAHDSSIDLLNVTVGESRAVLVIVRNLIVGDLLLWVGSAEVNLGVMTFQAKAAAERIHGLLAAEEPPAGSAQSSTTDQTTDQTTNQTTGTT